MTTITIKARAEDTAELTITTSTRPIADDVYALFVAFGARYASMAVPVNYTITGGTYADFEKDFLRELAHDIARRVAEMHVKDDHALDGVAWRGIHKVQEEMSELGTELGKLGAFPNDNHPGESGPGELRRKVTEEVADVHAALQYFCETNGVLIDFDRIKRKLRLFRQWRLNGLLLTSPVAPAAYSMSAVAPARDTTYDDYQLCFVQGNTAYFANTDPTNVWGDDWNDRPYEHNAGTPYASKEREQYRVCTVTFNSQYVELKQPCTDVCNSEYSVEDINSGSPPWLVATNGGAFIPAATTLREFHDIFRILNGTVSDPEEYAY